VKDRSGRWSRVAGVLRGRPSAVEEKLKGEPREE